MPVMPIARITLSTVTSEVLPPSAAMVAVTESFAVFSALTVALVWSVMPCLVKALWAKSEISASSTGSTRSSTSTTVTCEPMSR